MAAQISVVRFDLHRRPDPGGGALSLTRTKYTITASNSPYPNLTPALSPSSPQTRSENGGHLRNTVLDCFPFSHILRKGPNFFQKCPQEDTWRWGTATALSLAVGIVGSPTELHAEEFAVQLRTERPTMERILAEQLARRFRDMTDDELVDFLENLLRVQKETPPPSSLEKVSGQPQKKPNFSFPKEDDKETETPPSEFFLPPQKPFFSPLKEERKEIIGVYPTESASSPETTPFVPQLSEINNNKIESESVLQNILVSFGKTFSKGKTSVYLGLTFVLFGIIGVLGWRRFQNPGKTQELRNSDLEKEVNSVGERGERGEGKREEERREGSEERKVVREREGRESRDGGAGEREGGREGVVWMRSQREGEAEGGRRLRQRLNRLSDEDLWWRGRAEEEREGENGVVGGKSGGVRERSPLLDGREEGEGAGEGEGDREREENAVVSRRMQQTRKGGSSNVDPLLKLDSVEFTKKDQESSRRQDPPLLGKQVQQDQQDQQDWQNRKDQQNVRKQDSLDRKKRDPPEIKLQDPLIFRKDDPPDFWKQEPVKEFKKVDPPDLWIKQDQRDLDQSRDRPLGFGSKAETLNSESFEKFPNSEAQFVTENRVFPPSSRHEVLDSAGRRRRRGPGQPNSDEDLWEENSNLWKTKEGGYSGKENRNLGSAGKQERRRVFGQEKSFSGQEKSFFGQRRRDWFEHEGVMWRRDRDGVYVPSSPLGQEGNSSSVQGGNR